MKFLCKHKVDVGKFDCKECLKEEICSLKQTVCQYTHRISDLKRKLSQRNKTIKTQSKMIKIIIAVVKENRKITALFNKLDSKIVLK